MSGRRRILTRPQARRQQHNRIARQVARGRLTYRRSLRRLFSRPHFYRRSQAERRQIHGPFSTQQQVINYEDYFHPYAHAFPSASAVIPALPGPAVENILQYIPLEQQYTQDSRYARSHGPRVDQNLLRLIPVQGPLMPNERRRYIPNYVNQYINY